MPQREMPTANRDKRNSKPQKRAGVPMAGALLVAAGAAGGAFWAGDTLGYQRGFAQSRECDGGDPLARLDQQATAHQGRLAAARAQQDTPAAAPHREPPRPIVTVPPVPEKFSFHEALKGGPGRPQDRAPVLTSAAPNPNKPPALPVVAATPAPHPAPAPAPTTPAAPSAPSASGLREIPGQGDFTLQVGAFPDKTEALKLNDRLKALGYRPVIAPSEAGGSTWYRVRVGRFTERSAAEAGAQGLADGAGVHAMPVKH